jgi:hypothetical protein
VRFEVSRKVAAILFFAIVLGSVLSFLSHNEIVRYKEVRDSRLKNVRTAEWMFIKALLIENYDKSKSSTLLIKEKLLSKISAEYKDNLAQLRYDLDNPSINKKIYTILNQEIKGLYLNKDTDSNDPFVFTRDGIVADLSLDCTPIIGDNVQNPFRTWDQEYALQANPTLARIAVTSMLNLAKYPVFWEFSKSTNPKHKMINTMSLSELEEVFYEEGFDGLKTYEFINVTPIFGDKDLVERPMVSTLGVKPDTTKVLYVAHGFNIVDAIETNHVSALHQLDKLRISIVLQYSSSMEQATLAYVLTMVLLLTCFVGIFMAGSLCVSCSDAEEDDDGVPPVRGFGA